MLRYRFYLLLTSLIWGSTFIFQRLSTDTMGAFAFGGIRFLLGSLAILPLIIYKRRKKSPSPEKKQQGPSIVVASLLIGVALFSGSCLQQIGLFYTTAGKSAFITALYIAIVPLLALFFYQPLRISHLAGIVLSITGVYLLAVNTSSSGSLFNLGDFLTLISAFCWSWQIILVDRFVRYHSDLSLALGQFIVCSFLCFCATFISGETLNLEIIRATAIPLLYAGIASSGIAFTLQILGQTKVPPTEGSMIMSLEMVFAAIFGYIFLGEILSVREIWGAVTMSIGVLVCQLPAQIIWVRKPPGQQLKEKMLAK